MTLYFILFLQLVTLLTGASILSPQKIAIKDFIIWLLIITIIGLPLYNVIGFFAIFVVILFLIISLSLKTKQVFTNILSVCVPLIIIVVTDYFSQIMEMYVLKKVLNSFIVHYDRLLTVELLASMLSILICCFIKSLIGKFRQFLTLDRKYQSLILSFLLLTLVIFYFNIFLGQIQGFSPKHLILTGLLFFIYAVLLGLVVMTLIYILNKDAKMKQERILNQQLHEYTLQIEQLYTNLNSFRHDYLNILLSLEEGIRQENIEIIKDVYQSIIQPTKQLVKGNDYILGQLHKIQVVEI